MTKIEIITKAQETEREFSALVEEAARVSELAQKSKIAGAKSAAKIIADYTRQIDDKIADFMELRQTAKIIIEAVTDSLYRAILTRRFILGENWEQIAEEMHFSRAHIFRLRKKALATLKK